MRSPPPPGRRRVLDHQRRRGAGRGVLPGSRQPRFYCDGAVLRALSERGAQDWRAVAAGRLFREATAEGRLVETEEVTVTKELPRLRTERPAAVLRHERMPFGSDPHAWTPSMLRDAAL